MQCTTTPDPPSSQEAGPSRPALFTRLQTLLPQSALSAHSSSDANNPSSASHPQAPPLHHGFLKTRIVTWNMHESLPKGDLQELLGQVPTYTSPVEEHSLNGLPHLLNNSEHAYHLVVVTAQKCPSLSGIPLGLGVGFKLGSGGKEKEKDRERDKDKDKDRQCRARIPRAAHRETRSKGQATSGWTSILEDFFVHGMAVVGHSTRAKDKGSQSELGCSYSAKGKNMKNLQSGTPGPGVSCLDNEFFAFSRQEFPDLGAAGQINRCFAAIVRLDQAMVAVREAHVQRVKKPVQYGQRIVEHLTALISRHASPRWRAGVSSDGH